MPPIVWSRRREDSVSSGGEGTELPGAPVVFFPPFCPVQHDEPFGGTLVDGASHGSEHSTLVDAQSEASNHNATTGTGSGAPKRPGLPR